jgi:hypothetical protein
MTHSQRGPLKRYGNVISRDTRLLRKSLRESLAAPERRIDKPLVSSTDYGGTEGAAMCDEYSESRVRTYWRAMAHEAERELDETKDEETIRPIGIDLPTAPKAKPKMLAR